MKHFFNEHQEKFLYGFALFFLILIVVFYGWGGKLLASYISASFEVPPLEKAVSDFSLDQARTLIP